MKNQTYAIRISFFTIMVIITLFFMAAMAFAQEGADVYLQPLESEEGILLVDVMAENVTNLYGAEFKLKYDPTVLAVQDSQLERDGIQVQAGPLLPASKGFVVANSVDEAEGSITFAITLLNPAPAVNGGGPLARITFNLLSAAPTTIEIERVKLVAADLQTIPNSTAPLAVGGQPGVAAQAPTEAEVANQSETTAAAAATVSDEAGFPWWIVAAAILILGILGLVAFIALTGLNKPKKNRPAAQKVTQQVQRPVQKSVQQAKSASQTRPSAFK